MTFAEQIKQSRKAAALTQAQLADATGVTQQSIHSIETGTPCSAKTARALCDVLSLGPPWPARAALEGFAARELRQFGVPVEQTYANLRAAMDEKPNGYTVFEPDALALVPDEHNV